MHDVMILYTGPKATTSWSVRHTALTCWNCLSGHLRVETGTHQIVNRREKHPVRHKVLYSRPAVPISSTNIPIGRYSHDRFRARCPDVPSHQRDVHAILTLLSRNHLHDFPLQDWECCVC